MSTETTSQPFYFRIDQACVLDIVGPDALAIVHNLTTNEVKSLAMGDGCESFITDVRGKTLGHVLVFRMQDGYRLIGPPGQSERLAAHADRYTIREDAEPRIRDEDYVTFVVQGDAAAKLNLNTAPADHPHRYRLHPIPIGEVTADVSLVPWLGSGSVVILVEKQDAASLVEAFEQRGLREGDEAAFHHARIAAGFPWFGVDLDEKNLPQEADRDEQSLSFTKGCYLGQETVARLDALGQVQKKLVRWSIRGGIPAPETKLQAGDKVVGRLTSVAPGGDEDALAIGYARRSHFDPGSTATGTDETNGQTITATVL